MAEYTYTREYGDTIHSNPDTYNICHEGEPQSLASRIESVIPGVAFNMECDSENCYITTERDLTEQEEIDLSNQIAIHKAVDDWPLTPQDNEIPSGEIYVEDNNITSTTSSNPQQKLRLTLQVQNECSYVIYYSYEIKGSIGNRYFKTRVQVDDSIDIASEAKYKIVHADNIFRLAGFSKITLNQGEHTIDIDYWRTGGNVTIFSKNARLLARRL